MLAIGHYTGKIITITVEQMRMVDYLMENKYGINLYQMMENAGRSLAILARKYIPDGLTRNKRIAVLAGKGGNGGGVLVAARRLKTWGADVHVLLSNPEKEFKTIAKIQLDILKRIGVTISPAESFPDEATYDIILDGIYGYGLQGPPDKWTSHMIAWAINQHSIIIALDVPSGIELNTGIIHANTIRADATLTIAFPKKALLSKDCSEYTGKLYLADISVPPEVYNELQLPFPLPDYFATGDIVQLSNYK